MRIKAWLKYFQWPTLLLGVAIGILLTGFAVNLRYSEWLERYQGIAGSVFALLIAAGTISVTMLHREENKFLADRNGLRQLKNTISSFRFPGDPGVPLDILKGCSNLPNNALNDFHKLAAIKRLVSERVALHRSDYAAYEDCVVYFVEWIGECLDAGRYVPFYHQHDISGAFSTMIKRPIRADVIKALQADN